MAARYSRDRRVGGLADRRERPVRAAIGFDERPRGCSQPRPPHRVAQKIEQRGFQLAIGAPDGGAVVQNVREISAKFCM
jgi:hypothetical protein